MSHRSVVVLSLLLMVSLGLLGCVVQQAPPPAAEPAQQAEQAPAAAEESAEAPYRVAMVFHGATNDQSWNQAGYAGLQRIEEELGIETAFQEKVPLADSEEAMRTFASQDYDLVIGHGDEFSEAGKVVAEEFPEVNFAVVNGAYSAPNLASISMFDEQVTYLAGVVAARMTESNKVGYIGGLEIPPVVRNGNGFEMGVHSVNPDIEVVTTYLGDFNDAARGKEATLALSEQGVDVVYYYVDQAMLGIHEAARENDIKLIGCIFDQHEIAPELILTSATQDISTAIYLTAEAAQEGALEGKTYLYGLESDAMGLAPFYDMVPEEVEQAVQEARAGIISGDIDVPRTEG